VALIRIFLPCPKLQDNRVLAFPKMRDQHHPAVGNPPPSGALNGKTPPFEGFRFVLDAGSSFDDCAHVKNPGRASRHQSTQT
jgi:hypothetical protein